MSNKIEGARGNGLEKRNGFILPFVVLVGVLLTLVGYGLLRLGLHSRLQSIRSTADISARAAADAGLAQALYLMNQKVDAETYWDNSTIDQLERTDVNLADSYGDSYYSFSITGAPNDFTIVSTGVAGEAQRRVQAITRLMGIFEFAISVQQNLTLFPGVTIEGWTSDASITDLSLQIATNSIAAGSVDMQSYSTVNGVVAVGVGGDVDNVISEGVGADITGGEFALPVEMEFPPISAPTGLAGMGAININGSGQIGPADSGIYTGVRLGNATILDVNGGDVVLHVTGDITLFQSAEINVTSGSSLTVYLEGDWESKNEASVNTESQVPADFALYGLGDAGQTIDLKAKNDYYGTVYAPDADVSIFAKTNMYGAVVSENFEIKNNESVFYYDAALRKTSIDDLGIRLVLQGWSEQKLQ